MQTRKLELKDIAGYLPHGLKGRYIDKNDNGDLSYYGRVSDFSFICAEHDVSNNEKFKPILRPFSDLYKTTTHNGKEIVPIVELANTIVENKYWHNNTKEPYIAVCPIYRFSIIKSVGEGILVSLFNLEGKHLCVNMIKIFDFFNEMKIDYRGLINAGLAIDCHTVIAV